MIPSSRASLGLPLLAGLALLAAVPAHGQRAGGEGPFTALQGSWSGTGTVTSSAGTERIRCRAAYAVSDGGAGVLQNLRCASDSYNIDLRSQLRSQGGALSGTWSESTRGIGGSVSGSASPGQVNAQVGGPGFSAAIGVTTRANRQQISIRTEGAEVATASIALSR